MYNMYIHLYDVLCIYIICIHTYIYIYVYIYIYIYIPGKTCYGRDDDTCSGPHG